MANVTAGYVWTSGETVTPTKLNSAAAPTVVVADNEVTTSKILDGAVTNVKLATGLDASKLTTGTLPVARIADASLPTTKLAAGALPTNVTVSSANIDNLSIVNADVSDTAAIALSKLATGALPTGITVASANLVDGTIVNADINASAGIADTKLATISTAGKVSNSATTATNANTANAIVARDASGNFSAGTITATLTGNVTGTASAIADGSVSTAKIVDGNVTLAKLVTDVQQALLPAGAVQAFAMNSAPSGWLAANGSNVNRTTYAALFSAIGTTYGVGDGSTTFALPDLRGYFVRGSGTNSDGTASGTFGQKQADDLKSHTHTYDDTGVSQTGLTGGPTPFANTSTTKRTTDATGGTETRPANIALLYCIKF
jgi:microcystin-dependent protein